MIHVHIDKRYRELNIEDTLRDAAEAALGHQNADKGHDLSVAISGDHKLRTLNKQFRGEDRPTDVLSFPSEEVPLNGEPKYLGDVVISVPRARAQAKAAGQTLDAELQLLTVHGVLHLLGHDHSNPKEKEGMWAAQGEILRRLGLNISPDHAEQPHEEN